LQTVPHTRTNNTETPVVEIVVPMLDDACPVDISVNFYKVARLEPSPHFYTLRLPSF